MAGGGLPAVRHGSPKQGDATSLAWVFCGSVGAWSHRRPFPALQERIESPFYTEAPKFSVMATH